jgi:hypothetical protein
MTRCARLRALVALVSLTAGLLALEGAGAIPASSVRAAPLAAAQALTNPPIGSPPYPPNPALPYKIPGQSSAWATDRVEIRLTVNGVAQSQPFLVKGVDYEPTPIGGSAGVGPFNDFYFDNPPANTWTALPARDLPLMRKLGVNNIRTYGWWKWEPAFFNGDSLFPFWAALDWSTADGTGPFTDPNNSGMQSYPHNTHMQFLDLSWNNGVNPIYVWIGLSLGIEDQFLNPDPTARANARQFMKYTAQWAAKKYGNHPAVMGFVIGNELNQPGTVSTSDFWEYLNELNALVKASAPSKLTMTAFTDTSEVWSTTIAGGVHAGKTSPQIYQQDVWGFNPYNNPAVGGGRLVQYQQQVYNLSVSLGQPSIIKPLLFTEWGSPASTHQLVPGDPYPACWPLLVFPSPMICPSPPPNASPPGSSSGAAVQLGPTSRLGPGYVLPPPLQADFPGVAPGTLLPAGYTADYILGFWNVVLANRANNAALGMPNNLKFTSGGHLFEWVDEWWKAGTPTAHNGNANSANNLFAGGWGDEEWFGLFGVALNGRTCVPGNCQLVNPATGEMVGNPDMLQPRAAVAALYQAYTAVGPPPGALPPIPPPPPVVIPPVVVPPVVVPPVPPVIVPPIPPVVIPPVVIPPIPPVSPP